MSDTSARTEGPTKIVERTKPTLLEIGNRKVISTLRWNDDCIADFLMEKSHKWHSIADLSRVAWGQTTLKGKERARQKLAGLLRKMADRGVVLIVNYEGPHNRASQVKVANFTSQQERQTALDKLGVMKSRRDVSDQTYSKFVALVQEKMNTV